jgi:hypothetical protein
MSASHSLSKSMSINAHLSLSLFCLTSKRCHLTQELVPQSSLVCLASREATAGSPQPQHIMDATRTLEPLDSQPIPKSIVEMSHTALLGLPQPRVSNLHICFYGNDVSASRICIRLGGQVLFSIIFRSILHTLIAHHDFPTSIHSFLPFIRIYRNSPYSCSASYPACGREVPVSRWMASCVINQSRSGLSSQRSGSMSNRYNQSNMLSIREHLYVGCCAVRQLLLSYRSVLYGPAKLQSLT